jgi:hypothetical protein
MSIAESYLKSTKFKIDLISIFPYVMIIQSYDWPNLVVDDMAQNLENWLWLLKLLRIKHTGFAL